MKLVCNPNKKIRYTSLCNLHMGSRLQRGFDLIQLSIVTAIMALLIVGSTYAVPRIIYSTKVNDELTHLALIHTRLKTIYGKGPINNVGNADLVRLGVIPKKWIITYPTFILSTLAVQTEIFSEVGSNGYDIVIRMKYNSKNCHAMVQGAKGIFEQIKIDNEIVAEKGETTEQIIKCTTSSPNEHILVKFIFKAK